MATRKGPWAKAAHKLGISGSALRRHVTEVPDAAAIARWNADPPAWLAEQRDRVRHQRRLAQDLQRLARLRDEVIVCDVTEPQFEAAKRGTMDASVESYFDRLERTVRAEFADYRRQLEAGTLDWKPVELRASQAAAAASAAAIYRASAIARRALGEQT
jgi:hypothetical protein